MNPSQTSTFLSVVVRVRSRAIVLFAAALACASWVMASADAATLSAGDLVVGESRSPVRVSVVNPQTKVKTVVCNCTTLNTISSVAVKGNEKIYAIGQLSVGAKQAVVSIDPATGAQTAVSSGGNFTGLSGIALEADGSILVSQSTMVIRVNPSTGLQTVLSTGGRMTSARGMAVGPNGQIFVTATITGFATGVLPLNRTSASGVVRIDPVTGVQTVVAYGDDYNLLTNSKKMYSASDVTLDQTGNIFVLDKRFRGSNLEDETRLIKVDPTTGAQTMLTNSLKGVDQSKTGFDFRGIAILNGVLYAPDYRLGETGLPGISQVSASGGSRSGVTSEDFYMPTGLAVVLATPTPQVSGADCLFSWAERTYPQFFPPAGAASATYAPYYYRYYPGKGNYLASSSADNHIWVLGPSFGNQLLDVGPMANFMATAGCAQN
jgi:sugar lactone lactonase YvrE